MPAQHKYRPQHLALAIALALGCAEFAIAQQTTGELSPPSVKTPEELIKDLNAFLKATTADVIKNADDWNKLQLGESDDLVRVLAQESFDGIVEGGSGNNVMQLDSAKGGKIGESRQFQRLEVKNGSWTQTGSGDFSIGALVRPKATLTNEGHIAGGAVVQGTLFNNGLIGGDIAVLKGGNLSNMGNVEGRIKIREQGAFSGKGSVGALEVHGQLHVNRLQGAPTVKGNMSLSKTAVVFYEVSPDGSSETIKVTGTASLGGATLNVVAAEGEFPQTSQYTIIEANKIEGEFGAVSSNLMFMTPTLRPTEQTVELTYDRNGVTIDQAAISENGKVFGASVEEPEVVPEGQATSRSDDSDITAQIPSTATEDSPSELTPSPMGSTANVSPTSAPVPRTPVTPPAPIRPTNAAITALLGSSKATAAQAIEQLAAGSNANLANATLSSVNPVSTSMLSAMRRLDSKDGLSALNRQNKAPRLAAGSETSGRVWVQALGNGGTLDRSHGSSALQHSTQGLVLGADWAIDEQWRLGVIGSKSQTRLDGSQLDGDLDSWHLGTYALRQSGPLALRLGATYSNHNGSSKRRVAFNGFNDRLKGSYDAGTQQAFAEAGYDFGSGNVSAEPFAALGYQRYQRDSYTEKGGAAALQVRGQTRDNFSSTFGLRLAQLNTLDNGMQLTPRFSAGWKHVYGDVDSKTQQRLATGGKIFTVEGATLDRDSLMLDAGLDLALSARHTLGIGYNGEVGSDSRSHGVMGQWRMAF